MSESSDKIKESAEDCQSFAVKIGAGIGTGVGCLGMAIAFAIVLWAMRGFPAFWRL